LLPTTAEKLQNFFGVFLQFQIGVDTFDTLKEQTGLNVQVGNGLDEMLLEKLAKREEVFSASLRSDRIERICTRCFTIVLV